MPTTALKNEIYRTALPFLAPSVKGQMTHEVIGHPLNDQRTLERILARHHVMGSSFLLQDDRSCCEVYTSVARPYHHCDEKTLFRVASITKVATALICLRLVDAGAFSLDSAVGDLLPRHKTDLLKGISIRHLLSHTSGLIDVPAVNSALREAKSWYDVLKTANIRCASPGSRFTYCNFGFGLLGCVLEYVTRKTLKDIFDDELLGPLGMNGGIDASRLDQGIIMPICRVLPYRPSEDVRVPPLGCQPMHEPDPDLHFGYTAGSLYTDSSSLSIMMKVISQDGSLNGTQYIRSSLIQEMKKEHAAYGKISPSLYYGLGLLFIKDRNISDYRILGHQGYAYGCADGLFCEEHTDRQVIFLNGGCSEARKGRMGLCNIDLLRFALQKEMPSWR